MSTTDQKNQFYFHNLSVICQSVKCKNVTKNLGKDIRFFMSIFGCDKPKENRCL